MFPFVKDHDRWSLFPMLLKCHHVPHLVVKSKIVANQDFSLDILKITVGTNEPTKEMVNRNWKCSNGTKLMQRTLSVFWSGGENMNICFQLLFSLPIESLGLWNFKFKLKRFFPWLGYSNITNHDFLKGSSWLICHFLLWTCTFWLKARGLNDMCLINQFNYNGLFN